MDVPSSEMRREVVKLLKTSQLSSQNSLSPAAEMITMAPQSDRTILGSLVGIVSFLILPAQSFQVSMTQTSVVPTIYYANPKEEIVTCSQKFCLLLNPGPGLSHRSPLTGWIRMNEDQGNPTRKRGRAIRMAGVPTTGSGTRCLKQLNLQPFLFYFLSQLPERIAAKEKNENGIVSNLMQDRRGKGKAHDSEVLSSERRMRRNRKDAWDVKAMNNRHN